MPWLRGFRVKVILSCLIAVTAICLAGMAFVLNSIYSQEFEKLESVRSAFTRHQPAILVDLKFLDAAPPFPDSARNNNALPLLSQYLSWHGSGAENAQSASLKKDLSAKYPKLASEPEQLRLLMEDREFLERFDVAWMERLWEFDHFLIYDHPEVAARLEKLTMASSVERLNSSMSIPSFDLGELVAWAQIYLVKSHLHGRTLQGMKLFRKVAELNHSSSTLVGNLVAASMLKDEQFFLDQFAPEIEALKDWSLVSEERIQAYRRISYAMLGLTRAPLYGELPAEFESYMKPQNGLCAGVTDPAGGLLTLDEYLEPRFPFEVDFSDEYKEARLRYGDYAKKCGLDGWLSLLSPSPRKSSIFVGCESALSGLASYSADLTPKSRCVNWSLVPFVRRAHGLFILGIVNVNFWRMYESQAGMLNNQ